MDPSKESLVQQGKKRLAKFQKQRARSGSTTPSSSNSSSQASLYSTSNPSLHISTSNSKSNSRSNSIYLSNTLSLDEGSLYNTPDGGSLENSHNSESNAIATELKQYNANSSDKYHSRPSSKSESEMHAPLSVGNISAGNVGPSSAVDKTSSIESIQSNLAPAHNRSQELSDSTSLNDPSPVDKAPTAEKGTSLTNLLEPSAFSETSSLNEHNPLDEEGTVGKIIPISDSLEENINLDHNASQSNHEIQHEAHGAETTKGVHDSTQSQVAELTQQLASVKAENQYWSTMITHVSEQNAELLKEKQTLEEQIASLQECERENRKLKNLKEQQGGERDRIEALVKEIERLTSDSNQSRSTISIYENRVKELEVELRNAQSQIPPPNQIYAEAEAVEALKAEITSLQLQLSTSECDMSYEIQQLNARVQLLQSKCSEQNDTINELRETLSTKDAEIEELKSFRAGNNNSRKGWTH
ncbi:hypothetical protein BKA69DRAFT_920235 [Paraphysoderma sedebokerense]|nr:hypothetical protein BKA69DRAFT_920235 [Paraphysoderma sedebokerense]